MFDLNYLAVIVGAILSMILGTFWYSPKVFGNLWAEKLGVNAENLRPSATQFILALINALIVATFFAALINYLDLTQIQQGWILALFIWAGFILTTHFSGVIWGRKPVEVFLIDSGFALANLLMLGSLFTFWS